METFIRITLTYSNVWPTIGYMKISTVRNLLLVGVAFTAMLLTPRPAAASVDQCDCIVDSVQDCAFCYCTRDNGCWWYDDGCGAGGHFSNCMD